MTNYISQYICVVIGICNFNSIIFFLLYVFKQWNLAMLYCNEFIRHY